MSVPALRHYQADVCRRVRASWSRGKTPCLVLPTGAGKTVVLARLVAEHDGVVAVIAHRRELVGQLSLALARESVAHRVVSPEPVVRAVVRSHVEALGRSWYSPAASVAVIGVDSMRAASARWCDSVTLWVQDEAHHLLRHNKWGAAIVRFPRAVGLGVTATPGRADGRGIGAHADGVFSDLVVGPTLGDLVAQGYLSPARVYAPPSATLRLEAVPISRATGDYSAPRLVAEVRRAQITGDVVGHYLRHAAGKRGVTFAVDVAAATELAAAYQEKGVTARVVHAGTPASEREAAVRLLASGDVLQIVNVDIFGEGFDLPAIEVVSFARPTASYPLYAQQFGRALRPMDGKPYAIILDHVGNVTRHGLPDPGPAPTLDSRERRSSSKAPAIPGLRMCLKCTGVYERVHSACPYCGCAWVPAVRTSPALVDGDLCELDGGVLAGLRAAVEQVDRAPEEVRADLERRHVPELGVRRCLRLHRETQDAQADLRSAIDWWAGVQRTRGESDSQIMRRFFLRWGVDVLSARALHAEAARSLRDQICDDLPYPARVLA